MRRSLVSLVALAAWPGAALAFHDSAIDPQSKQILVQIEEGLQRFAQSLAEAQKQCQQGNQEACWTDQVARQQLAAIGQAMLGAQQPGGPPGGQPPGWGPGPRPGGWGPGPRPGGWGPGPGSGGWGPGPGPGGWGPGPGPGGWGPGPGPGGWPPGPPAPWGPQPPQQPPVPPQPQPPQ